LGVFPSRQRGFNKLARTFTTQMEALKRYRGTGEQKMVVEHVHVHQGGQAIVGQIPGVGGCQRNRSQPHEMKRRYAFQKAPRCSATSKRSGQPCQAPAVRGWTVCRFHGARGGAPKGRANGACLHGLYTAKAADERQQLRGLLAMVRETVAGIS
jgi:hypothetical protein